MKKHDYTIRNRKIYEAWSKQRMTFTAIGRIYGLSRERIRQIVRQMEAADV